MVKNIKTLNDMIKSIDDKMNQLNSMKIKKKSKRYFKKSIGRPTGDYPTKQKKYCEMLNTGKINQPKQQTLEFYQITKKDDGVYVLFE